MLNEASEQFDAVIHTWYLGLDRAGSVCNPLAKVKKEVADGYWGKLANDIENQLLIIRFAR